jgi:hypothetical protein
MAKITQEKLNAMTLDELKKMNKELERNLKAVANEMLKRIQR